MRDLALLSSAGLLVALLLLLAASSIYHSAAGRVDPGLCVEQWDQQHEWMPRVECLGVSLGSAERRRR